ncbi:hypothetical protein PMLGA01_140046900 [Plasmodium malariae]|uniref:Uncharacterized protein n=1 Tax=Plasmodium malariae TaxID=5858 RepID=A0A1C3L352_PLAMA|nr:hypothetical protein PMLGA01_140046900 [Plasmodium malariae]
MQTISAGRGGQKRNTNAHTYTRFKYSGEPDFSDFTRLMTGYYNICKIYIKRKDEDREELIPIVEKVNHFHFVLFHMYNYLLKHKHFNYSNVIAQKEWKKDEKIKRNSS